MRDPMRALGKVGGLALTLGLTTAAGALLGHYLDGRWGTEPWLVLLGTLCGMGAGFFEVVSVLQRISDER